MNVLLISYGDYDFDGRLRELCKIASGLGTVYAITRGSKAMDENHRVFRGSYPAFIREVLGFGKEIGKVDVLFLDNRKAIIPGMLLKKSLKPLCVIQDCRELYITKEVGHLAGKLGCLIEKYGIPRSDIVISANRERAEIMVDLFGLKETPLVYENLRQLEYSSEEAKKQAADRFAPLLRDGEVRIISSSGCSLSRTNDVLVRNLAGVSESCRLFLVGDSTPEEVDAIKEIAQSQQLENVEILGRLNQDELKYLIQNSHIGIVNYHQKDTNNKYCASGKIYEFAYEGIPVVTTTNPPLKNLCDATGIGLSDDSYAHAINGVLAAYPRFQNAVTLFAHDNPVAENNGRLLRQLQEKLRAM